jgi:hypothetical protein
MLSFVSSLSVLSAGTTKGASFTALTSGDLVAVLAHPDSAITQANAINAPESRLAHERIIGK